MQQKTTQLANTSAKLELNVSKDKTKVTRINNTVDDGIVLDGDILVDIESFTTLFVLHFHYYIFLFQYFYIYFVWMCYGCVDFIKYSVYCKKMPRV